MAPSDVNNSARAQMGGEKRWYDRGNSTQTTTGTNTAYVLTYASTQAALYDGFETSFILDQACGATPTLNVDGLGARTMRKYDLATSAFIAIGAGDFLANQVLRVRYNLAATRYDVISASFWPGAFPTVLSPINLLNSLNEAEVTMGAAPTMNIGAAAGNYIKVVSNFSAVVTITIASPAVIGASAHGLLADAAGSFATTGALPTGLVAGTTYYVINPTTNTFQVAATPGGSAVNTSGTQSGVQTFTSASNISAFDTIQVGTERVLEFGAILTLTHNSVSMINLTGANITTATGDSATYRSEGSGNWRMTGYSRADGKALVSPSVINQKYVSPGQAITAGGTITLAHGLGTQPLIVIAKLHCVTGELGYTAGQEITVPLGEGNTGGTSGRGVQVQFDATNLAVQFGSAATPIEILTGGTGSNATITLANWTAIFLAFA